jgi:hypothetical protein
VSTVLSSAADGRREALILGPRPASVLPGRDVPDFGVIRVGRCRMRHRLRATVRRRRVLLVATAVLCSALAALACLAGRPHAASASAPASAPARAGSRPTAAPPRVLAPVRLADPATVRLLRPGDRVDVLAADGDGGAARTVARHARVQRVPEAAGTQRDGALVVLKVPRSAAGRLAGAAAHARLSVTLW